MQLARWRAVTVIIGSWSPPTAISAVTTVITSAGGAGEVRGLARERQPRQGGLRVEAEPLLHRGSLVANEAGPPRRNRRTAALGEPGDVLASLPGVSLAAGEPGQRDQAGRLL